MSDAELLKSYVQAYLDVAKVAYPQKLFGNVGLILTGAGMLILTYVAATLFYWSWIAAFESEIHGHNSQTARYHSVGLPDVVSHAHRSVCAGDEQHSIQDAHDQDQDRSGDNVRYRR
jgi:hypothetical protein